MHEAPLQSINRGLSTVSGTHLFQYGTYVYADGLLRNLQVFSDFSVAAPLRDAGQHLCLSRRKLDRRHTFRQAVECDMRKVAKTSIHILDGVQQFLATG